MEMPVLYLSGQEKAKTQTYLLQFKDANPQVQLVMQTCHLSCLLMTFTKGGAHMDKRLEL